MSVLVPPVQLACPANKFRIDYILNLANQKDFEFTPVSRKLFCHSITPCFIMPFVKLGMHKTYLVEKHDLFKKTDQVKKK